MNNAYPGCLCTEIHCDAPIRLCFAIIFWKARQAPEDCWFLICYNREQERGMEMYFHKCVHASILVPPITHLDAWWPRSRIALLNIEWMHMKTKQNLDSIMDNPECRRLGIGTRSVTRSTKRTSFFVLRLTPIPNTMQYARHAWMQLIYNLACTMLWNGIHDARGNMAYTMR